MSNPFRGNDVAADTITPKDLEDFEAFMREKMSSLLSEFAEMDRIVAAGDERLFEERFGHLSRPRSDPVGRSFLTPEGESQRSLCQVCRKIFIESIQMSKSWIPQLHERYAHHVSLVDLHEAATSRCPMCLLLWTHISGYFSVQLGQKFDESSTRGIPFDYITFSISKAEDVSSPSYLLNFVYAGNDSTRDYDSFHSLQLCLVSTSDRNYVIHNGSNSLQTGSDSTLTFAADCISQCEQTHTKCSTSSPENWKPSRLIDLGPLDEPVQPRLLVTENTIAPISYATLSHRWGSAKMFQLTSKNIDILQQRIPPEELSKTFQDAFIASKRFGMRFLWIDSLCILQDQPDDWQREAAMMKDIYSWARFNISATGADTSDDGLFFDRERLALTPFVVNVDSPDDSQSWMSGSYYLLNPSLWSSNISKAPLNQRGWVLQERVLARRIIHFGRNQVFFECHELDTCEAFPKGLPDTNVFQNRGLGAPSSGHFKRLDPEVDGGWLRELKSMSRLKSDPALNIFSIWGELVEIYSSLTLTKWEDKLVAFSGIAKTMRHLLDDEYLAGLWRRQLPYHMLWSRRKDGGLSTEPMTYIAPSWSWASVQAPVTLHPVTDGQNEDILIDIIKAETYTQIEDVTGSVFGGFIKLRGYLRHAECAVWFNDHESLRTERKETRLAMKPQGQPAEIIVWPDETDQFGPQSSMRRKVMCLPIQIWRNDKGDRCTEGLILEELDFDHDSFKRMGKFKIAVGAKHGKIEFYEIGKEVWMTNPAREVLSKLDHFKERVITII